MFPQNLFFQIKKEGVYIKMEKSNSTQCNKNNKIRVDHKIYCNKPIPIVSLYGLSGYSNYQFTMINNTIID